MPLGETYVSLAQLKSYLGVADTADDAQLTDALAAASRAVEKYCDRQFNSAGNPSARVYNPCSSHLVEVDDFSALTSLKTDEGNDGTFEVTWSSSEYQLEPLNGVVDGEIGWPSWTIRAVNGRRFPTRWARWTPRRASVEVTATWGWAAVPAGIKQATLIMAAEKFKLATAPLGVAGYGDFGPIRVRDNPMAARLLDPYRRHPVLVA